MRKREFDKWCSYPSKGKGVILFDECPAANNWIIDKKGISSSEWVNCLKMIGNVAPTRAIPGRSSGNSRCRHCDEIETLSHVLGFCHHGLLIRNSRHHHVRSAIANSFRQSGFTVHEEVHCIAENGSNRRIDMIVINQKLKTGTVIDPTVRLEISRSQPYDVDKEKRNIYEPCIPDLLIKYQLTKIKIIGLLIGARGTITNFFEDFRKTFNLPKSLREQIVLSVLKGSSCLLQNHLYH